MNRLLEQAKAVERPRKNGTLPGIEPTKEEVEMAVEMLRGKITVRQYAAALGITAPGNVMHRIPTILRWGLKEGCLRLEYLDTSQN